MYQNNVKYSAVKKTKPQARKTPKPQHYFSPFLSPFKVTSRPQQKHEHALCSTMLGGHTASCERAGLDEIGALDEALTENFNVIACGWDELDF